MADRLWDLDLGAVRHATDAFPVPKTARFAVRFRQPLFFPGISGVALSNPNAGQLSFCNTRSGIHFDVSAIQRIIACHEVRT